ncbi:ATP-binding cassette domain-containing protein [Actinotalea sp. M2MS4P-6]|uniref:ABC transporter ATP-binding protein n=1 Tax=Actinotalea sp. M2MS4P-6 TaxID=2983762 RepID=UPI0021E4536F|nr:ABC transporter ATP-binding protein [Actinotalea sp. M2MS4P-6]MCV2394641.1 ATP-binding cassette domain-containing protein [Actinotalea sp. M2MS4P-6]
MIRLEAVSVTYPGQASPTLRDVDVSVAEGELCLVVGPTGAGKSTLLRAVSGLVPHFTGGTVHGRVVVDGRDTRDHRPRDLADVVGVVQQDPARGFVTETVEEELAYAMEQLGLPSDAMRARMEEVLDLLGLVTLRHRALRDLSGGEQQRVAIGAVLTAHPRVLVLDEPTSALDPAAADDVLAALTRLVHDHGMTVLLAEHRLERVVQYADRVLAVGPDGSVAEGAAGELVVRVAGGPPLVELAALAGWDPVPLSVRDARRRVAPLRARLAASEPPLPHVPRAATLLSAHDVHVRYPGTHAVRGVGLELAAGQVTAVMGRNGAGKSSLLWAVAGAAPRAAGTVLVAGRREAPAPADPAVLDPREARRRVALVPQDPGDLLYLGSVAAELAASDAQADAAPGTTAALFAGFAGAVPAAAHPRDLSEGQRLGLALAVQLAAGPPVLVLDEPTRGLDYAAKRVLARLLAEHARAGGSVLLSSHDVEFVAQCADRVVVLADGSVVSDAPAREVLVASPTFAPQVAKVLHPLPLLTVDEVRDALAVTG